MVSNTANVRGDWYLFLMGIMSKQNIVQCWTASDSINRILPGAAVPCLATSPKWGDNAEKYTDRQIYRQKDTQTEIYDNRCAPCIHDNNFNQTNLGSLQVLRQHFLGRKGVRSQIRLKKANRARKGGHLGCSTISTNSRSTLISLSIPKEESKQSV